MAVMSTIESIKREEMGSSEKIGGRRVKLLEWRVGDREHLAERQKFSPLSWHFLI